MICGAEGWTDIENFGNSKLPWLKTFLELPSGSGRSMTSSRGKSSIWMASSCVARRIVCWANELVLGQRKVDQKSNEITAIPELLKILALSGCIVTIDAMGTQINIAKTIVEAEADYVLSVKENQGHLYEDISVLFAVDQAQTTNKDHGRIEVRECWSTSNPEYLNLIRDRENWLGLKSIAMVIGTRILGGKETKPSGSASLSPVCPRMQNAF